MALQTRITRNFVAISVRYVSTTSGVASAKDAVKQDDQDEEFRVLNLRPHTKEVAVRKQLRKMPSMPPRFRQMAVDQDWGSVWPGPKTFHPAAVPLPVRQGFTEGGKASPSKFVNAELMKIPNFLHLTPPVVKRQCEAIKKFCTPWPKGLETDEKMEKHFPLRVISTDYCLSSPTIRNNLARVMALKFKLASLKLDEHATDKFLRLVKNRYNAETDEVTIVADRCPLKKQNYDYAMYLLTAVCHESRTTEPWEAEKTLDDMEKYEWAKQKSRETSEAILNWGRKEGERREAPQKYAAAVERLMNEGENAQSVAEYKGSVLEMLGLEPESAFIVVQGGDR